MDTVEKSTSFVTRRGNEVVFEASNEKILKVLEHQKKMGADFPSFGIFVITYNASKLIEKTISRIPVEIKSAVKEVFLFDDSSPDNTFEVAKKIKTESPWSDKLFIYKNPKNMGYGGNQKIGYRYGIEKGMDYIIMLHGDGQYAHEYIPDLILAAIEGKHEVVFGSRMINKKHAIEGSMPYYKFIGNQVLTTFENMILGTKLHEFHSGYKMYSTSVLEKIPFEENTDDFHFDSQIIVQCRALNVNMHEIPIKTFYGEEDCNVNGFKYAKDVCMTVLEYRLHQLHIIRKSIYFVKRMFVYTRKYSSFSSHEKVLSKMRGSAKALDIGGSNGLLTRSLKEKSIKTICIDSEHKENISPEIEEYHQHDLEKSASFNFEREFDYIVLADVIERVRNAPQLMTEIQKFLKEDGKIIASVPNIAIWFYRISLLIGRFNYGAKGILDERHVRFYTKSTLIQLIERSGYKIIEVDQTGLPFEVVFETIGRSRVLKFIDYLYYQLVRLWPRLFAYQYVITAEITKLNAKDGEGLIE